MVAVFFVHLYNLQNLFYTKKGPCLKREPNYCRQNYTDRNNSNFDYLLFIIFHPKFNLHFSIYYFENIAVKIVNKNIIPTPIAGFNIWESRYLSLYFLDFLLADAADTIN